MVKLRVLARTTDSKWQERDAKVQAEDTLLVIRRICPHDRVVCLCSAYRGSYSHDYEDSHLERWLCLRCDTEEDAKSEEYFKTITTTPFRRFELGKASAFNREPLDHDLDELIIETSQRGYPYFGIEWQKQAAEKRHAEEQEQRYQQFKAQYLDRLTKELTQA